MSMIIRPKNWKEFQHYKDRNPPWIKLHKSLLDNYEFHSLQLASKALAPCYWLLASEHTEGQIEVKPDKIAWRFRTDEVTVLATVKELIDKGFFEVVQDAIGLLADRLQHAIPETETETETEPLSSGDDASPINPPKKPKAAPIPYNQIYDTYERICCVVPYCRPKVRVRGDTKRESAIRRIWNMGTKTKTMEWWEDFFTIATGNEHWMLGSKHKGGTWPGADFDFLLHSDRVKDIIEGNV